MHLRLRRIYPSRGDVLAILLVVAFVGGFMVLASFGRWHVLPDFGFGSGWGCIWPGEGDPVCLQKPPAKPANPN